MERQSEGKTTAGRAAAFVKHRAVRWTAGVLAVLFLAFGALGYFWLPGFAKAKLETLLSEQIGRPVRVQAIEVSPYALSVTVRGFSIAERADNGTEREFLGFDRLFVNVSAATLFRATPIVSELRLEGPRAHVARLADGRFNFSDILDRFAQEPEKPDTPTPQFSVSNISISGGSVVFEDRAGGGVQRVTELSLGVPFVANTPGTAEIFVQPSFSARLNGAQISLGGEIRPFAPGRDATVEFNIADFDLMNAAAYLPADLPARLNSARLDADLVIRFARPQGQSPQVLLSGKATLRDVAASGAARGEARARLEKAELTLEEASLAGTARASLALTGFSLARRGGQPLLGFAGLDIKGVAVNQAERTATVSAITLAGPSVAARRLADGGVDLQRLAGDFAAPAKGPAAKAKAPAAKAGAAKPARAAKMAAKGPAPWTWSVARVEIKDGGLRFADESLGRRARQFDAHGLRLILEGLASTPGAAPSRLDFAALVNERGSMAAQGALRLEPLGADLTLNLAHVDLVALQGWATQNLNALLTRGEFSAKGRLRYDGKDAAFTGDVALIDLNVLDKLNATDLVRWRSLRLAGLDAGSTPPRLAVREVSLANFFARLLLTPEGSLNVQNLVRKDEGAPTAKTTAPEAPKAQAAKDAPGQPAAAPGPQIRIGRINLSGGDIVFNDRFVRPNYTANLTELAGYIGPVKAGSATDVAIRGKVDRTGPLEITGKMDPLAKPLSLDIQAKARGIEMANFSPYSGRYVGYAIEKGKLSVDLRYHVDKGALKAENQVFLDQLTFGKKVNSPDAMNIPVNLVVALLSNSRGEIDINLPIEGSLDDPKFSLGGVIAKVIMNLLVKAATSPFRLLASLFGGGEDLSSVAFEPGRTGFTPEAEKALSSLAKALRDRPRLKLELAGHADPQLETEGLKRAILDRRVKAQKATELARRGKASGGVDEIVVSAEEYPTYLTRVYKAADIKKPRNLIGIAKTLPVEAMEDLLLQNIQVRPEDLERLAQDRGIATQAWLVDKGGVEQARVFLLGPRVGGEPPKGVPAGGRVDFSLR
jgi:uncharacterized protein involved in outer membrane biogenesis